MRRNAILKKPGDEVEGGTTIETKWDMAMDRKSKIADPSKRGFNPFSPLPPAQSGPPPIPLHK